MKMRTLFGQIQLFARLSQVSAALLVVGVGAFYFAVYRPHNQQYARLTGDLRSVRAEIQATQSRADALPEVAKQVVELQAQLDSAKRLPKQQEMPDLIRDLTQLSRQSALRNFRYNPGTTPMRSEYFNEQPMAISFEGDFLAVFNFLRNTEELKRMTRVKQMNVRNLDPRVKDGQVQVDLSMGIYYASE
jgi:Tfp pilus assembly protein PilO